MQEALKYQHLGETVKVTDDVSIEARAEVAVLSRNVLVRGSDNKAWHEEIKACPEGFHIGN